jgi:hypothetical protein
MKTFDELLKTLPVELGREIFSFLIPDPNNLRFCNKKIRSSVYCSYSSKYENAFLGKNLLKNEKGFYLSRINKKNGKHRYYITEEMVDVIHVEHNDQLCPLYMYEYYSKYVGKNIEKALVSLLLFTHQ